MATKTYTFNAAAVADVWTAQVTATGADGDRVGVVINGKTVSYAKTGAETTAALLAAQLQAALSASTIAEFQEYTWAVAADTVTATLTTPGNPNGVLTAFDTGTAGVTVTNAAAGTGPSDLANTANWSGGTLPADGDDAIIENSGLPIWSGLTALSAVALASLKIPASYTGAIGLPARNGGSGGYAEYRDRYLTLGGDPAVAIGEGDGKGSGRIYLAVGTGTTAVTVFATAARAAPGDAPAVVLKNGGGTTNSLNVSQGDVGVALETGATARIDTIRLGNDGTVKLTCGPGATLGTIAQAGGTATAETAIASLTMYPGAKSFTFGGAANLTAVTVYGGTFYPNGTGTYGSVVARGAGAVVDCSQDPRPKTWTNSEVTGGAALIDPDKCVTFTNPLVIDATSLKASNLGPRFGLQRT